MVNVYKEREITFCQFYNLKTNLLHKMTDLLQFTINIRKSHRQPQYILQLVREDRMLFV